MKKLRSQKAETLVETLMAIVVVVLVMLFLSTAVSTASKVNAKVRKTDVALTYENAVKGSEAKTLTIKDKNSATKSSMFKSMNTQAKTATRITGKARSRGRELEAER